MVFVKKKKLMIDKFCCVTYLPHVDNHCNEMIAYSMEAVCPGDIPACIMLELFLFKVYIYIPRIELVLFTLAHNL